MLETKKYKPRRPDSVEAVRVTRENAKDVALWTGGVVQTGDITPGLWWVLVPTLGGNLIVNGTHYVVRNPATGGFSAEEVDAFDLNYQQIGIRDTVPEIPPAEETGETIPEEVPVVPEEEPVPVEG